jgi:hypothetical protein
VVLKWFALVSSLLFVFSSARAASEDVDKPHGDFYVQKIGLTYDKKGEFAYIAALIQKTVLAMAENDTNIFLFPGDKIDLETIGIRELNANINMIIEKNSSNYIIGLYQSGDKSRPMGFSETFGGREIIPEIQPLARKILDFIKAGFPLKKIEELKKIEIEKIGVSEFETLNPVIGLRFLPGLSTLNTGLGFQINNSGNIGSELTDPSFSMQAEGILRYRAWNAWIGGGLLYTGQYGQTYRVNAGAGYGIFGSLIILGIEADYFESSFLGRNQLAAASGTETINYPDGKLSFYTLGPVIQFNITRAYYIQLSFGIALGSPSVNFNFSQPQTNTSMSLNNFQGPAFLDLLFNFEVAPRWWIGLNYMIYGAGINNNNNGGSSGQDYIDPVSAVTGYRYNLNILGIGIEYEF